MTTFALSSIGKANASGAAATGAAQPDASASGGASPFDRLLQNAGGGPGPSNAATGGGTAAGTTATAAVNPAPYAAKPADTATKAGGSGSAAGKQTTANDAAEKTDQSPATGNDKGAAAGSAQTDSPDKSPVAPGAPTAAAADTGSSGVGPKEAASAASETDAVTSDLDPKLLHDLASALDELEQDEKNGVTPSKDLLKRLQQAVNALSGYLAALQPGAAPVLPGTPAETAANGETSPAAGVSDVSAALKTLLNTLASNAAPGRGTSSAAATGSDAAPAPTGGADGSALAQLANKVEALSSALAQSQPSLAGDLDHLAKQLQQLPAANAGGTQQAAAAPATTAAPVSAGDAAKAGATAWPASGQLAAAAPQGVTAQPISAKDTGPTKHDKVAAVAASTQPTGTRTTADKASANKGASDDGKKDAAPGATPASAAGNAPASPAQSTSASAPAPNAAIAPTSAQPTAGPAAAAAQQAQAAYQAADTATINLPQMAFEIARHVQQGSSEFQIRLDPADLGRVNVTLAVDATGNVSAHLAAERADTLALLRQDAGSLNQALAQAGVAGGKTNLQFSLSQNPFTRQDNGGQPTPAAPGQPADDQSAAPIVLAPAITRYRGNLASSNLNIFV